MIVAVAWSSLGESVGRSRADIAAFDKDHFRNGEYWRILTGAALHLYPIHIFFNAYALYSFGRLVELLTNRAHLPMIFLFRPSAEIS